MKPKFRNKILHVWAEIVHNDREGLVLVDTGAVVSIMLGYYLSIDQDKRQPLRESKINIKAGNSTTVTCHGQAEIIFRLNGKEYTHSFYNCDEKNTIILGVDFLRERHVVVQPGRHQVEIDYHPIPTHDIKGIILHHKVKLMNTVYIRPGEQRVLRGNVVGKFSIDGRPVIMEPTVSLYGRTGGVVCKVAVKPRDGQVPVRLLNPGEDTITVYKGTVVGVLSDLAETTLWGTVDKTSSAKETNTITMTPRENEEAKDDVPEAEPLASSSFPVTTVTAVPGEVEEETIPEHVRKLFEDSKADLDDKQRVDLQKLLHEYSDIFAQHSADFGKTTILKHNIETGDEQPVKQRPRRFPRCSADELRKQVSEMAENSIIRPSASSWASNALLVRKKDGSYRMCIDYRELNAKTKNLDEYMLPRIDDTIDALSRAKFFCTLDLIQGYHQVELEESAKPKTAFIAPQCNPSQWEFNYMPFGLKGAPKTFQCMMDHLRRRLDYRVALAYLDDIILYGTTIDECVINLRLVFERVRAAGLKLKPKKCSLFQRETLYLGHIISGSGVRCDPEKIQAVKDWRAPRHVRQVRSFMGLVNYYRKFIKNYADMAIPLYDLQKKKAKFYWGEAEQRTFEDLKKALITAPVIAFPQPEVRYILDTDASGYAIGGVLYQLQRDENGQEVERVIAYA